jgi:tyrosyl-tRNA synthetase
VDHIIDELKARRAIAEYSQKGDIFEHLREPRTCYCGFDPTADSLHVGSLMPLVTMFRLISRGHTAIALLGGGTGLIGDPSFKSAERELPDPDMLRQRCAMIGEQCQHLFANFRNQHSVGKGDLQMRDNSTWLAKQNLLDFLRDVGKHFSVNAMVKKEAVATRIARDDQGISFTEFSYALLQAYDFSELYKAEKCTLQLGGSDQWGNIVAGTDLIRRLHARDDDATPERAYGITLPLITRADGGKFGKTEAGTVWLSPKRTSPYAFHQFWLNIQDGDVYPYLRYFSFKPVDELAAREQAGLKETSALLDDKRMLADEITALTHGSEAIVGINRIREALFVNSASSLSEEDFAQLALDGLESTPITGKACALAQCLHDCGLARTPKGEVTMGQARKLIQSGAIHVNGQRVEDVELSLQRSEALHGRYHLLRRGKKHFHLLRWE